MLIAEIIQQGKNEVSSEIEHVCMREKRGCRQ